MAWNHAGRSRTRDMGASYGCEISWLPTVGTRRKLERKILSLRRNKKLGPDRIAGRLELPASTVHAVLARNGVSRLAWMDRPTGRVVRRYEHERPGDLVHVDIKKLGQIPPG